MTNGHLEKALEIAGQREDNSLINCLERLQNIDDVQKTTTIISNDFAPLSFYFERKHGDTWAGNGGIIFHGSHDGFGSGSAPTFSVTLEKTNGWSIHT
jgi:hypothetical protein